MLLNRLVLASVMAYVNFISVVQNTDQIKISTAPNDFKNYD